MAQERNRWYFGHEYYSTLSKIFPNQNGEQISKMPKKEFLSTLAVAFEKFHDSLKNDTFSMKILDALDEDDRDIIDMFFDTGKDAEFIAQKRKFPLKLVKAYQSSKNLIPLKDLKPQESNKQPESISLQESNTPQESKSQSISFKQPEGHPKGSMPESNPSRNRESEPDEKLLLACTKTSAFKKKREEKWEEIQTIKIVFSALLPSFGFTFKGNLITSVEEGSLAEKRDITDECTIYAVNDVKQSTDTETIQKAIDETKNAGKPTTIEFRKPEIPPLMAATAAKESRKIKALLKSKADVNMTRQDGATPASIAAEVNCVESLKILIHAKADINRPRTDGSSPLYIASMSGWLDISKELVQSGAKVDQPTNITQSTPLFIASQERQADIVDYLVKSKADADMQKKDDGATPLIIAAQKGYLEIAQILMDPDTGGKADVDKRSLTGSTPLFIACQQEKIKLINELINYRADVNIPRYDNVTPLLYATYHGYVKIVRILLENKADATVKLAGNGKVMTALSIAQEHTGKGKGKGKGKKKKYNL